MLQRVQAHQQQLFLQQLIATSLIYNTQSVV